VTVLNGSGRPGQANDVAGALQAVGFDVVGRGNVSPEGTIVPRTQVRHAPGDEAYAQRVARHLTSGAELVENPALERGSGSVELVTGADFTTVREEPTPLAQATTTTAPSATSTTTSSPTSSSSSTTATAPPPTTEPPGHAVGEIPRGANCG
jgi:LytR cell envelope-related transcriptional attenuator